jgi:ribonuclease E
VPHSIPEGAKTALAQIAASTRVVAAETPDEAPAVELPAAAERPKKARKKRSERAKAPRTEADVLHDSVLDALPEPKAPGQGRNRRRVTTAALTGTPVSVNADSGSVTAAPVASGDAQS